MKITQASLLSTVVLLNSTSAALAQSFTGAPGPRVTPVIPVTRIQTTTPTFTPTTSPQLQTGNLPVSLPVINIPIYNHSSTILPTDSLNRQLRYQPRTNSEGNGKAPERVFEFTDLSQFLKDHGWTHGPVESTDPSFLNEDTPTIDTDLLDQNSNLLPVGYVQGSADHVAIKFAPSCKEVLVFTTANQFAQTGKDHKKCALIAGEAGSVASHTDKSIVLYDGRILVDSGDEAVTILTKLAGMKLEPQSTVVVECRNGKVLSLHALAGKTLRYRLASSPDTEQQLAVGESFSPEAGTTKVADAGEMVEEFLHEKTCHSSALTRLHHHVDIHTKHAHADSGNDVPLTEAAHVFGRDGARVVVSNAGLIGLISGSVLLHTQAPQVVRTNFGDLYLQAHSLAAIERWQGQMRVFCCSEPKSAIMISEKFGVPMEWGEEIVITDHEPTLADIVPNDNVGRRRFEAHKLTGKYCALSDFCLDSFLCKSPHLHSLRKPSTKTHEDLRDRLMKTAASLQMVTGQKGRYLLQSEIASQPAAQ